MTARLQPWSDRGSIGSVREPDGPAWTGDTWNDADYEYFFGEYLDDGYRSRQPQEVKELPPIENTLSTATSLTAFQRSPSTNTLPPPG